ncbi:MAG: hypothetical protein IPI67_14295 [Myxococcales bacterium]|nr:hypothetical protein [Myxococcales bacterium]
MAWVRRTCVFLAVAGLALALVPAGCGAKTGLPVSALGECAVLTADAEAASLDAFVMLDSSGSMAFKTADGVSKAVAMRDALAAFMDDPESQGIGISLDFFPEIHPEVPARCVSDAACGQIGACYAFDKLCLPSQEKSCDTNADCAGTSDPSDACYQLGGCASDADALCLAGFDPSAYCKPGEACLPLGACLNRASCDVASYTTPVVSGTLPAVRTKLLIALDTRDTDGATPTWPALDGVHRAAREWSAKHPKHKVIVLLATDGFPTVCDPEIDPKQKEPAAGIPRLSEVAAAGLDAGIATFVIGVFSPKEEQDALINLGKMAQAGGTEQAFIVTTDEPVATELLGSLNAIRKAASACEYAIPWPDNPPDPAGVAVRAVNNGAPLALQRVATHADCPVAGFAFHFDQQLAPGTLPGRIILCPATCSALGGSSIEIRANCVDGGAA